jgi:N-acetylmuramoyl-L-alanine amidase
MSETHIKQWQKLIGVDADGDFGGQTLAKSKEIYNKAFPNPTPEPEPTGKTGADLIKLANTRIGEDYVYGANVDLNDPDYHGEWDCAEFCSWVVKQITGKTYGCVDNNASDPDPYTGGWKADVLAGRVISISISQAAKTKGAILLRFRANGKHIVFSNGDGTTVEAKGAAYGVCKGSIYPLTSWDYGIEIPGIKY